MSSKYITYNNNGTTFTFFRNGDLFKIENDGILINQLYGNTLDGSLNQIYLRVLEDKTIHFIPLIGSNSSSDFHYNEHQLMWSGCFKDVNYKVDFQLTLSGIWFWNVSLSGIDALVDIIYGQDVGNATIGAVRSNEAYMSQYLDHHITKENETIVISSRQNQIQDGKFPVVEQGSLNDLVAFSTDGYQFFGKSYKETNIPEVLTKDILENEVYQYEFAYTALQSKQCQLTNDLVSVVFYGGYKKNQDNEILEPIFSRKEIESAYYTRQNDKIKGNPINVSKYLGSVICGQDLTQNEIDDLFPCQYLIEEYNGKVFSFFSDNYHHVVLKCKELEMERSHGHILLGGTALDVDSPLMSTTVFMPGIFNSQIVLGNTSMNKLLSNSRNSLNILKNSGQRIYIKQDSEWCLLTMPSAFEMGLNSATWYYKLDDDMLKVKTYTSVSETKQINLEVNSKNKINYTFLVTNQFVLGDDELSPTFKMVMDEGYVKVTPSENSVINEAYPDLVYYVHSDSPYELADESLLIGDEYSHGLLINLLIENQNRFKISIQGNLTGKKYSDIESDYRVEDKSYLDFINTLLNDFKLTHTTEPTIQINTLARWYTQNMLVHYLSPHGLEQYGGAAWGTRDVSQGPVEFFLAVNQPKIVASIIYHIYENQFSDLGNWPQWFMFDNYEKQKSDESHGDVIVWPMKVVSNYISHTGDESILKQKIPYTERATFCKTEERFSLLDHIKKEIEYIESNFLENTYLSCYGDGDWDDTLQPADANLKKNMASSWTVALTFQVISDLSKVLKKVDKEFSEHLMKLSLNIKNDFNKYMLSTETIPGFVYKPNSKNFELMIHPQDKKTGIHYRLLPMTRSIIAELLTPEEAIHHMNLIEDNLLFPDGVRLMNQPANYHGGVSTYFKRAEQSANFGREIGLQYVHAHIRFVEAMAKMGRGFEVWNALHVVCPIGINNYVKNAKIRQSNTYFSSSDGDFKTRYDAQTNFSKLKKGEVGVKGGWRIYSSGPGIYLGQLISNVLGVRETKDLLIFDPVIPQNLNHLLFDYKLLNRKVKITYNINQKEKKIVLNSQELFFSYEENSYRLGGIVVNKVDFEKFAEEENYLDIYC